MTPFETITLYIDNSAPVLARVMYQIRQAETNNLSPAEMIKQYIKVNAVSDMRLHGDKQDRENAGRIFLASRKAKESDWNALADHYIGKHKEGNDLREYLPEEMR